MNKKIADSNKWSAFQIASIIILVIIIIFNVLGTLFAMQAISSMSYHYHNDEPEINKMPYTTSTPYIIEKKPADPSDNIIIR